MSPPKYTPPTDKPLVRVDFSRLNGSGDYYIHTYENGDGCRDYGFLFALTEKHPADSAMLAANEEVALSFGYLVNKVGLHVVAHPIIKFKTVEKHRYKVNLETGEKVIRWQVLESNGKGYIPINTTKYKRTVPMGNAGPFCKGNIVKK